MADEKDTLDLNLASDDNELSLHIESTSFLQEIVHTDTTEHWNAQVQLVAERGHIYVYSDYMQVEDKVLPAIKIGDGTTYLIDLPFVSGDSTLWTNHIHNNIRHITDDERNFWNDKVTCFISAVDAEHLIFTKESEGNRNG